MIFKNFLISLIFIRLSLLNFDFLRGGSLRFKNVASHLRAPLLDRIEAKHTRVVASLNLRGIN